MRLCDFAIGRAFPLLSASLLWERESSRVKPIDLTAFLRSLPAKSRRDALAEIDAFMTDCWEYCIATGTEPPHVISFAETQDVMTFDEFERRLSKVSVERRRAILFCLETGLKAEQVVAMTWKQMKDHQLSQYAKKIAYSQPRHIKLPYVFWERCSGVVAIPLVGFSETIMQVSGGRGLTYLRAQYSDLLPISYKSDFDSALSAIK